MRSTIDYFLVFENYRDARRKSRLPVLQAVDTTKHELERAVSTGIRLSHVFLFEGVFGCLNTLRELFYCRGCCQRGLVPGSWVMVGIVSQSR
jgi:hypothetical protein